MKKRTKYICIIFFLLLCVGGVGYYFGVSTSKRWIRVSNNKEGYFISCPPSLQIVVEEQGVECMPKGGGWALGVFSELSPFSSPEAWMVNANKGLLSFRPLASIAETDIGGVRGVFVVSLQEETAERVEVLTVHRGRLYSLYVDLTSPLDRQFLRSFGFFPEE